MGNFLKSINKEKMFCKQCANKYFFLNFYHNKGEFVHQGLPVGLTGTADQIQCTLYYITNLSRPCCCPTKNSQRNIFFPQNYWANSNAPLDFLVSTADSIQLMYSVKYKTRDHSKLDQPPERDCLILAVAPSGISIYLRWETTYFERPLLMTFRAASHGRFHNAVIYAKNPGQKPNLSTTTITPNLFFIWPNQIPVHLRSNTTSVQRPLLTAFRVVFARRFHCTAWSSGINMQIS